MKMNNKEVICGRRYVTPFTEDIMKNISNIEMKMINHGNNDIKLYQNPKKNDFCVKSCDPMAGSI